MTSLPIPILLKRKIDEDNREVYVHVQPLYPESETYEQIFRSVSPIPFPCTPTSPIYCPPMRKNRRV